MEDNIGVAGPSQPKKRKTSKKLSEEDLLRILEDSDFDDYDESENDEVYNPSSEGESDDDRFEVQEEPDDVTGYYLIRFKSTYRR